MFWSPVTVKKGKRNLEEGAGLLYSVGNGSGGLCNGSLGSEASAIDGINWIGISEKVKDRAQTMRSGIYSFGKERCWDGGVHCCQATTLIGSNRLYTRSYEWSSSTVSFSKHLETSLYRQKLSKLCTRQMMMSNRFTVPSLKAYSRASRHAKDWQVLVVVIIGHRQLVLSDIVALKMEARCGRKCWHFWRGMTRFEDVLDLLPL